MLAEIQFNPDVLLAMAALITAIGGVASTLASIRMKRMEQKARDEDECFKKLLDARKEAEAASDELHAMKMRNFPK